MQGSWETWHPLVQFAARLAVDCLVFAERQLFNETRFRLLFVCCVGEYFLTSVSTCWTRFLSEPCNRWTEWLY